ncbi:MAG: lysophospholipid acyltransferase family protein [Pseudomonadota bacterium]
MIRDLVFKAWIYGSMGVLGILFIPAIFLPKGAVLFGIRLWTRGVRWGLRVIYDVRTEFRGLEHLPDQPCLIAAKHQSMFDTVVTFLFMPPHVTIMKRELLRAPVFGQYAARIGTIAIDRGGSAKTLKKMARIAARRIKAGLSVLIYPEGTRRDPGAPPDYKIGVYALYKDMNVPCTPLATNSGLYWPQRGRRVEPGVIVYEVLPQLPTGLDRPAFMARLEGVIEPATNGLLAEAERETV